MGSRSVDAGLCERCEHARVVASARGSRFYLCNLAATDRRYRKYPALPVVRCEGYSEKSRDARETQAEDGASID
jgi:hypothetical protein